jgi:hypothetical protein
MTVKATSRIALLGTASAAILAGVAPASANPESFVERLELRGDYMSGDKHNHTTCTDGTTSVRTLVDRSTLVYELDWFAQTGHGGSGNRDCRFDDVATSGFRSGLRDGNAPGVSIQGGNSRRTWVQNDVELKGDDAGDRMWRWQSLIEYAYPDVANAGKIADKTTWLGIESVTPGHEHTSMGILGNQFRTRGDAYATGQFEYLWDRGDDDFSGGEDNDFEDPANNGVAKIPNEPGIQPGGHPKAVQSVAWLREHHQRDSYFVPAHVERQGAFVPDENRGYNPEHLRDFHNAGLFDPDDINSESIGMGGEFAPGHQLQTNRGSYALGRPTVGLGTYGGAGCYGAAEMIATAGNAPTAFPITDETPVVALTDENRDEVLGGLAEDIAAEFGGNPFTEGFDTGEPIAQYAFCKPGVSTLWDAFLGEGRRWSMFYSSDWHNRGSFGPYEPYSTNDAWPGEYQKIWAYARGGNNGYSFRTARAVVDGMRQGNSWSVMGDLIDEFYFVLCQGNACATMGETLRVAPNSDEPVTWYVKLRDPEGTNHSPYAFPNASLMQLGIEIPTNEPQLDNIDVISGSVTGPVAQGAPEYETLISNPTTRIMATVFRDGFEVDGEHFIASGEIPVESFETDMYFRVRGTNLPKGTPNETDADGNPLLDYYANNIPCPAAYVDPNPETPEFEFNPDTCPFYMPVNSETGETVIDFDVEAWTDLWFHGNAIFVDVPGHDGLNQEAPAFDVSAVGPVAR